MRILAAPSPRAAPLLIALGLAWPFTATADAVASATLSLHEVITRAVQMAPPQRLADGSLALAQAQQEASHRHPVRQCPDRGAFGRRSLQPHFRRQLGSASWWERVC